VAKLIWTVTSPTQHMWHHFRGDISL